MASLLEQMEHLQKQQAILTEKIREEAERNKKLAQQRDDPSIERLEALIEPITQYLDYVHQDCNFTPPLQCKSLRELVTEQFEEGEAERLRRNKKDIGRPERQKKYTPISIGQHGNTIIGNEEIFVTLLGIIKKQDARIEELEKGNKLENTHLKRASTIEFSDLQMMKRY